MHGDRESSLDAETPRGVRAENARGRAGIEQEVQRLARFRDLNIDPQIPVAELEGDFASRLGALRKRREKAECGEDSEERLKSHEEFPSNFRSGVGRPRLGMPSEKNEK